MSCCPPCGWWGGSGVDCSSIAARFRLPLLGSSSASKIVRGLRIRWPRPVASVVARLSIISMASSLGTVIERAAGLAGGGSAATEARFTSDSPGDRARCYDDSFRCIPLRYI